ncbi:MAG: peptidylprolyl isomerase [Parachlamydiaceae bacterium]|nr:peptidylprolyl isomerase [Parachlamydiaceae bacterium]
MNKFIYFIMSMMCLSSTQLLATETNAMTKNPIVVIETTQGNIEVALKPDVAPKATENFLKHAEDGYYNGIIFHRVIKGFMVQGGDPTGTGRGGKSIWDKPFEDEVSSTVKFDKPGILAMANAGPKSNGSQFFITTAPTSWLNNKHTIFGEVVKGYDVVQKIENTKVGAGDRPIEEQKIIRIYLKGAEKPAVQNAK